VLPNFFPSLFSGWLFVGGVATHTLTVCLAKLIDVSLPRQEVSK
jgi:hypothetical protein